jgi:ribosome-interacting GTPase 1
LVLPITLQKSRIVLLEASGEFSMKKLTQEDIKELMDEFEISEAEVRRIENRVDESLERGEPADQFHGRICNTRKARLGA